MNKPLTEDPSLSALIDELIAMDMAGMGIRLRCGQWVSDKAVEAIAAMDENDSGALGVMDKAQAIAWGDIVTALVRRVRKAEERER